MSMRRPINRNARRAMVARGFSLPPPIGGLNARDALSNMDERDALILDNFFPQPTFVEMRRGHSSYATGMTGAVESVMEWAGPANSMMFAATENDIWDVTNPGPVGAAEVTGLTNGRWQFVNFATSGGNFLVACNGADDTLNYDGSSWTTPVITGATSANFIYPCSHQGRLWFVEKNTLSAWYLAPSSISGAASEFPLGQIFQLGGQLVAIGTLSQDSGSGQDDYIAFVTNNGEVAVYQGADPDDPAVFSNVGVFQLARPVPLRPLIKVGGDIVMITDEGAISFIKSLNIDKAALVRASITGKIATLFNRAVQLYRINFGWQGFTYPRGNMAIFNIPVSENELQTQFVMNTITGAWCTFSGLNANCWGSLEDQVFFGGNDGTVYLFDDTRTDNGDAILGKIKTAFNYFGSRGINKYVTLARPVYRSNGSPSIAFGINMDFSDSDPGSNLDVPSEGSGWGVGLWGDALWSGPASFITSWRTIGGVGYCGAIRMNVLIKGQSMEVNSFDVQAQPGGPV